MNFTLALLIGLIISFISSIVVVIENGIKSKTTFFFTSLISLTVLSTLIFWMSGPTTAWPLLGGYSALLIFYWCIIAGVITAHKEEWTHIWWFPISLFLVITFVGVTGWKAFNAERYSSLIGEFDTKNQIHWSKDIQPLDPTHLRLVPGEVAYYKAKTSLTTDGNTLGSQFPLSEEYITLQKINSDWFYLIPLDFKDFKIWTNADYVPGYVKISATDTDAKPILVLDKKIKYTPEAYFSDNLDRKLFNKYHDKVLRDYSFESDDEGNVYYVITTCHPTIAYSGDALVKDGVIVFNPETGEDTWVSVDDPELETTYFWIDRIMVDELVVSYINNWGSLKDGWWNSFWTHSNILEGETPTINYSSDGRCTFVVPITSNSEDDQSMTGLMYCDARTGKFTYYTTSGGSTEQDITDAVNAAVKYKEWHASNQIIYDNVYGQLSALVPVLGATGTYQGLAIVKVENRTVAFGSKPQEALIEYQKLLMNSGGQISVENNAGILEYKGKIARIGWEISSNGRQFYLYFDDFKHSFMVSSDVQSELSLTKEGDEVEIKYVDSKQASVPTTYFKNLTLDLQVSSNEKSVISQMTERKEQEETTKDVKDFKEKVKNMSDKEIEDLLKTKK